MDIKTQGIVNLNFGRAFTTQERKEYAALVRDVEDVLEIKDTSAIIFDFNVPSEKGKNTAIGTTFSETMKPFIGFIQSMMAINSVQLQPQGKIEPGNTSPYSGTNFAIGEHIIDLNKLTTDEYACLLTEDEIRYIDSAYPRDKHTREYKTDYDYVIGNGWEKGIQRKSLENAFFNFKNNIKTGDIQTKKLNREFKQFKSENSFWLEKNALFEALSTEYRTGDINRWSDFDKNLYSQKTPKEARERRIQELKHKYTNLIEFENFVQFIADKQQKESKKQLNAENISLYGDCLIGFSQSELWGNIDCFRENLYYGGPDPGCPETNNIQAWGLPALDYIKLGECNDEGDLSSLGEVGKFLYDKYTTFFKRYDGIRMDAAWQFVTPFIYQAVNGTYKEVELPEINFTIFNILKAAAKDAMGDKFDENHPDNIMLELVGISADKGRDRTRNTYPHLYTTAYAEYDETPKKFLEKGYENGKFYVGVGCHDNESLIDLSKSDYKRYLHTEGMRRDYGLVEQELAFENSKYKKMPLKQRKEEDFRTAKFAEIFTSAKQFFTLPDMFGMAERINISGKASKDNWTVRIPSNYEKFYFSQLSNGYGLNLPKVLANALRMKHIDDEFLIRKCNEAAEILRSPGPMTEADANEAEKNQKLDKTFEYLL